MRYDDECKNCGGGKGLHHYQTMQCPVGGVEARIDRKQEWMTDRFEPVSDEVTQLRDALAAELARGAALQERIEMLNAENHALNHALQLAQTRANEAEQKLKQRGQAVAQALNEGNGVYKP